MRFLSLFSGIEAASAAWCPLGWTCVGAAENDKFPSAVLAHHYPDVPNLGDITKITEDQIKALGPIDLIVGGFPCQDVSVAGRRAGMKKNETRTGLFYDAIRIVQWARKHCGLRFLLIENVPGIYSNRKGEDFAAVVNEILGTGFRVPKGGWRNAGVAAGPNGLLEWCTLDAQFFGLAQRRLRMFALADFGNWMDRPQILLEPESLRGDPPPRREAGQSVAGTLEARAASGGYDPGAHGAASGHLIVMATGQANAEVSEGLGPSLTCNHEAPLIAHTLRAEGFDASEDGTGRGVPLVPIAFSCKDNGRDATVDLSPTLRSMGHADSHQNGGGQMAVVFPINTQIAMRHEALGEGTGLGIGSINDPAFTLQASHCHAVAVALRGRECGGMAELGDDKAGALRVSQGGGDKAYVLTHAVRRLIPKECERLQGFPDDFTLVPVKKGKRMVMAADGPRYKALGNSMAVPVMRWIGERIDNVMVNKQ